MNFYLKHTFLKLLFIEIHKFKKKKILEEDEDDRNDQQSDAEQTGNEGNVNDNLFVVLSWSRNCTIPGEDYIGSDMSPTGVTDPHASNQETSLTVIRKHQCVLIIQTCLTRNSVIFIQFCYFECR